MGIMATHTAIIPMSVTISVIPTSKSGRNYGIDALRVIAMLMVCVIHINLFTKAHVEIVPTKEYFYYFGIWTETVGMIGVNLYALITGYVCVLSNWRYSRYVRLWILVAFYTILLFGVGYALSAAGVLPYSLDPVKIVKCVARLGFGSTYWYFAAYTGLFFVIPFLNPGLRQLSKVQFSLLVVVLLFLLPIITIRAGELVLGCGYNMIWLVALYVAGAYIKLYPPRTLGSKLLLLIACVCTFQPLVFTLLGLPPKNGYTWPIAVVYSISLFIVFTRVQIKGLVMRRVIEWAAPVSFSVYLLHVHPWSWRMLCKYVPVMNVAWDYPWWFAIAGGFVLYLACAIVDKLRTWIFSVCKFDSFADCIASMIEQAVRRILTAVFRM